ncbi:PE family protein, partial [Mycobacterium kansasii]
RRHSVRAMDRSGPGGAGEPDGNGGAGGAGGQLFGGSGSPG